MSTATAPLAVTTTAMLPRATPTGLWDYSSPPPPTGPDHNYPTLLYSWWCTCSAVAIILARLIGRKIRSNELFREDWIMMIALIPLIIRQAFIHVVLLYRTNNVQTVGYHFTAIDLAHRSMGSRLVIAARLFYALFIWVSKLTVSEFLKRITVLSWRRSYEYTLRGIRIFLVVSFVVVVIATLTECQPFDHFWQVVPDPGPQCRTGYANLIAMGACDILTDILLVAFPIPIVLRSGQTWKRKLQLASLFSLSIIPIAITATRIPQVIRHLGRQQYRTVWASSEILASAAVSNAVILGSFLRDKGTKRNKYRSQSMSDSIERASVRRAPPSAHASTQSEEDLFRSLGIRMPDHLRDMSEPVPRPAPFASSKHHEATGSSPDPSATVVGSPEAEIEAQSEDSLRKPILPAPPSPTPSTKRSMSFFDVGGLLDDNRSAFQRDSGTTTLAGSSHSNTVAHDFARGTVTSSHHLFGSRAFLQDMGGLFSLPHHNSTSGHSDVRHSHNSNLSPHVNGEFLDRPPSPSRKHYSHALDPHHHPLSSPLSRPIHAPTGVLGPMLERRETQQSLQDAGGLLSADIYNSPAERETHLHGYSQMALDDPSASLTATTRHARERLSLREVLADPNTSLEDMRNKDEDEGDEDEDGIDELESSVGLRPRWRRNPRVVAGPPIGGPPTGVAGTTVPSRGARGRRVSFPDIPPLPPSEDLAPSGRIEEPSSADAGGQISVQRTFSTSSRPAWETLEFSDAGGLLGGRGS